MTSEEQDRPLQPHRQPEQAVIKARNPETRSSDRFPPEPAGPARRISEAAEILGLCATIKEQVLGDIKREDALDLAGRVSRSVQEDLDRRQYVESRVETAVREEIRKLGYIVAAIGSVLTLVGYKGVQFLVDSAAQGAADKAIAARADQLRAVADDMRKDLKESGDEVGDEVNALSKELTKLAASTRSDVIAAAEKAKRDVQEDSANTTLSVDQKVREATSALDLKANQTKEDVLRATTSQIELGNSAVRKIVDDARAELEREVERVRKDINTLGDKKTFAEQGAGEGEAPISSEVDSTLRYATIITKREFAAIPKELAWFLDHSAFQEAASLSAVLMSGASRVDERDLLGVLDQGIERLPVEQKNSVYIDAMFGGIRANKPKLAERAISKFRADPIFTIYNNDFEEFAMAVFDKKSPDELLAAFQKIDLSKLFARGLLNLLSAMKSAGLSKDEISKVESLALRKMRASNYIDRPADYASAYFAVEALTADPVVDDKAVVQLLDTIRITVFRAPAELADPWDFAKALDAQRARLAQ